MGEEVFVVELGDLPPVSVLFFGDSFLDGDEGFVVASANLPAAFSVLLFGDSFLGGNEGLVVKSNDLPFVSVCIGDSFLGDDSFFNRFSTSDVWRFSSSILCNRTGTSDPELSFGLVTSFASFSSVFADPEGGGCAESTGAGLFEEALVELEHVGTTAFAFARVVVLPAVSAATAVLKEEEGTGAGLLEKALVELEHVGTTAFAFGRVVVLPAVGVATAVVLKEEEECLTGNKAVLASGPSLGVATVTSITLFLCLCRFGSGVVVVLLERNVEGDAIIMRDRDGSCVNMIPPPDTGEDSTSNTLEEDLHDSGGLDVSEVTAEIVVLNDWSAGVGTTRAVAIAVAADAVAVFSFLALRRRLTSLDCQANSSSAVSDPYSLSLSPWSDSSL
jgi:hypothetical protein